MKKIIDWKLTLKVFWHGTVGIVGLLLLYQVSMDLFKIRLSLERIASQKSTMCECTSSAAQVRQSK